MGKNWPNDPRVGCNLHLVQFEADGDLEELKQFLNDFERDEVSEFDMCMIIAANVLMLYKKFKLNLKILNLKKKS